LIYFIQTLFLCDKFGVDIFKSMLEFFEHSGCYTYFHRVRLSADPELVAEAEVVARLHVASAPRLLKILHSPFWLVMVIIINPEQVFDVAVYLPETISRLLQFLPQKQ
jgi:hypothetical protein